MLFESEPFRSKRVAPIVVAATKRIWLSKKELTILSLGSILVVCSWYRILKFLWETLVWVVEKIPENQIVLEGNALVF